MITRRRFLEAVPAALVVGATPTRAHADLPLTEGSAGGCRIPLTESQIRLLAEKTGMSYTPKSTGLVESVAEIHISTDVKGSGDLDKMLPMIANSIAVDVADDDLWEEGLPVHPTHFSEPTLEYDYEVYEGSSDLLQDVEGMHVYTLRMRIGHTG